MRYPSVFSSLKSAAIAATLTITLAATAGAAPSSAPRQRGERLRREDPIVRVLKAVKRFFGISSESNISVPIPQSNISVPIPQSNISVPIPEASESGSGQP